jgi:hypothetical protein
MSDEELFWRASMVPRVEEYPYQRVPKVAFLFLTRGPLPLAPLWERFFNGSGGKELFSVYVHTTPGYRLDFPPSSPFHRRQVPSKVRPYRGQSSFLAHFRPRRDRMNQKRTRTTTWPLSVALWSEPHTHDKSEFDTREREAESDGQLTIMTLAVKDAVAKKFLHVM